MHLAADFPNGSQWNDWAKYTDEGWYANAAIRHYLVGSWYLPDDFNPAVVMPVWPLLVAALFHFTGVSLTAIRALTLTVFVCDLVLVWVLIRWQTRSTELALLGVSLGASSAFLYAFNRLAILEPLMAGMALLAWLLALRAATARSAGSRIVLAIALGVAACLLVLVKTTGVCLLPAAAWLLWYPLRRDRRGFLLISGIAAGTAVLLWCGYYLALVRPRFAPDFHYFFAANVWARPQGVHGWLFDAWSTFHAMFWAGRLLPSLAMGVLLLSLSPLRSLWRLPIYTASWFAIAGLLFFVWWHNNTQPRYYTVIVYPLLFVITAGIAELWRRQSTASRLLGSVAVACTVAALISGSFRIATAARHPQYTFLNAAQALTRYVDAHPNGNRLLLSVSGDQVSLMTGLPAICDDFGLSDLATRIDHYQPGWFAAWNDVDAGTLEDINARHRLQRAASFPALDDSDRNLLVLYRVLPERGPNEGVVVDSD